MQVLTAASRFRLSVVVLAGANDPSQPVGWYSTDLVRHAAADGALLKTSRKPRCGAALRIVCQGRYDSAMRGSKQLARNVKVGRENVPSLTI
jgi:hypothetical protein